jgi:hypothetical protein
MGDHIKRCGNSFRRLACGPTLLGPQRGTRRRERRPKGDCGTREMRKHRVDEESPSLARHRTAHVLENPWLQLMVPVRQGVAYGVRIGDQLPRRGSPASHDFAPALTPTPASAGPPFTTTWVAFAQPTRIRRLLPTVDTHTPASTWGAMAGTTTVALEALPPPCGASS